MNSWLYYCIFEISSDFFFGAFGSLMELFLSRKHTIPVHASGHNVSANRQSPGSAVPTFFFPPNTNQSIYPKSTVGLVRG
jgi:hypothetical protein